MLSSDCLKYDSLKTDPQVRMTSRPLPQGTLVDVSLLLKGHEEDRHFLAHPPLRDSLRRGNTFLLSPQGPKLIRRGLRKFFDFKGRYFSDGERQDLYQANFGAVHDHLSQGGKVKVVRTDKLDGCNAQLGYDPSLDKFIIASKNCALVAGSEEDMAVYSESQYGYARQIGSHWFSMLAAMDEPRLQLLKQTLAGHTFVGEFVGTEEHLIHYDQLDLVFYAMVSLEGPANCQPFLKSMATFRQLGLKTVEYSFIQHDDQDLVLSDPAQLLPALKQLFCPQQEQVESEGYVLYFQKEEQQEDVLSMVKLKNYHYVFLRIVREYFCTYAKHLNERHLNAMSLRLAELQAEHTAPIHHAWLTEPLRQFVQENQSVPALGHYISCRFIRVVEAIKAGDTAPIKAELRQMQKSQRVKFLLFCGLLPSQFPPIAAQVAAQLTVKHKFVFTQTLKGENEQVTYQAMFKALEKKYHPQPQFYLIHCGLAVPQLLTLQHKVKQLQHSGHSQAYLLPLCFWAPSASPCPELNDFPMEFVVFQVQQLLFSPQNKEEVEAFLQWLHRFDPDNQLAQLVPHHNLSLVLPPCPPLPKNTALFFQKLEQIDNRMNRKQFLGLQQMLVKLEWEAKGEVEVGEDVVRKV